MQTRPTGPQTHRRIAKPRRSTPDQIPWPWVSELLVYTEENLLPTLSREAAGHTQMCHWAMAEEDGFLGKLLPLQSSEDAASFASRS